MDNELVLSDMISLPKHARNVEKYTWEKIRSANSFVGGKILDESTPVEINIEGHDDSFLDVKVCIF